jgi:hypothetical protein
MTNDGNRSITSVFISSEGKKKQSTKYASSCKIDVVTELM